MPSLRDHEIKFLTDAEMYLALKHEAEHEDRTLGGLLRHLCRVHLQQRASALSQQAATHGPETDWNRAETGC